MVLAALGNAWEQDCTKWAGLVWEQDQKFFGSLVSEVISAKLLRWGQACEHLLHSADYQLTSHHLNPSDC